MVKDKQFYKTIFKISLPAAFQALISFLVVIVDDIMVSSMPSGVYAQAAVSQVNSLTAFYTATVLGLVSGSSVLISQYWGKRDVTNIKKIFPIVIGFCLGTSLLFLALALIFPQQIIGLIIGADEPEVIRLALEYFAIICFSYVPYAITNAFIGMLRSVEVVKITLYVSIVSLFVNMGCNYVLIFGKLGFPVMGVAGAAIGTLIARVVELIIICIYTFKIQTRIDLTPRDMFKTEKWLVHDYMKFGFPVGVADMLWALILMIRSAMVGHLGAVFIASMNITNSIQNLSFMFTFALAGGACVVIGKTIGSGDYKKVREYSKTIQIMFAAIGVVMAILVFLFRKPFVSIYGSASDPQVYSLSVTMIAILAATVPFSSYHASCFMGINRGGGDSRFVAVIDMICGWFVILPATFLGAFVFNWPLPVVFLCTKLDQTFKWIIAYIRLRGNKWIKNVTRSPAPEPLPEPLSEMGE